MSARHNCRSEGFGFWVLEKSRHKKFTFSNGLFVKSLKRMSFTDNIKFVNIGLDI